MCAGNWWSVFLWSFPPLLRRMSEIFEPALSISVGGKVSAIEAKGRKYFFIPIVISAWIPDENTLATMFTCRFRFWRRLKFMKVKMHQLLDLHFMFFVATRCPWMSMAWLPLYPMVISGWKGELSDEQLIGGRPVMHIPMEETVRLAKWPFTWYVDKWPLHERPH